MDDEIAVVSDGDGVAFIGDAQAVDRYLASQGLESRSLDITRLRKTMGTGGAVLQAGSEVAANSGRWVKLTAESAQKVKLNGLREAASGVSTGVIKGDKGQIKGFVEFARGPGAALTNPAMLAGAAGIMQQVAMQQAMEEIGEYLAKLDEKVDDVLRAQQDAVIARMIGVGFALDEAMTIRESRGHVGEVTWSKVQSSYLTIAEVQGYALRQLEAAAEKLERKSKVGDAAEAAVDIETKVREWLAVLARSFQLIDAFSVIELDHVMLTDPDGLDQHRVGMRAARQERLDKISDSAAQLMARMDAAASRSNTEVLRNPRAVRSLVGSSNRVAESVDDLLDRLGLDHARESVEAKRWRDALGDVTDRVRETSADGVGVAKNLGSETIERAGSVTGRLSSGIASRLPKRTKDSDEDGDA